MSASPFATEPQPLLELRDLHAGYGKLRALHGVSLKVMDNEAVALIGANGAGKSTILRAISGLISPSSGNIYWKGRPLDGLPAQEILRLGVSH